MVRKSDKQEQERAALRQFPSAAGEPGVEVSERQADSDETAKFVRTLVVGVTASEFETLQNDEEFHDRQHNAVRQEAINQGLRPTGDVSYEGSETVNAKNVKMTYSVPVEPARTAVLPVSTAPADESHPQAREIAKESKSTGSKKQAKGEGSEDDK